MTIPQFTPRENVPIYAIAAGKVTETIKRVPICSDPQETVAAQSEHVFRTTWAGETLATPPGPEQNITFTRGPHVPTIPKGTPSP